MLAATRSGSREWYRTPAPSPLAAIDAMLRSWAHPEWDSLRFAIFKSLTSTRLSKRDT